MSRNGKVNRGTKRTGAVDTAVGQRIRAIRLEREMSQTDLGERCGVTFQQIQKYENGKNRIATSRLMKIAEALGVSLTALTDAANLPATATLGDRLTRTRWGMRLARAALNITRPKQRASLVAMAESLRP